MKLWPTGRATSSLSVIISFGVFLSCGSGSTSRSSGNTSQGGNATKLTQITITPANQTIAKGATLQLSATGYDANGTAQALGASMTWQTSKSSVATINTQGDVTGVAVGVAQVSATYQGVTGSTSVTVGPAALVSIGVTPASGTVPAGLPLQFSATGTYSDGSTQALTPSATWSSSAPSVATINAAGLASGLIVGNTTITAVSGTVQGTAMLTVTSPVLASVSVTPANASIDAGDTQQFTAMGTYSDGSTQNLTSTAAWSSSASAIASVSSAGAALGNTVGTATISATAGSFTGTASLTVTPPVVVALNIVPATLSMVLESSSQLQAMATMSNGTTENMTGTVAWSSAQPNIASVNSGGLVTANNVGSTTILAADNGVTGSATVTVTPLLRLFFTTYYSNANYAGVPDATVRIVNDGNTDGNLYADIYVLDDSQELQECCGCLVSKDGLLSESVNTELTASSLTGKVNHRGAIKIISDANANGWDNGGGSAVKPTEGLRVTATHVQSLKNEFVGATDPGGAADWAVTETEANVANLGAVEKALLPEECGFIVGTQGQAGLGSGAGVCTCTPEDFDF